MTCSVCNRSGYGLLKIENKSYCKSCVEGSNTVTTVRSIYGGPGINMKPGLQGLISESEWLDVIKMCKDVSKKN